MSDVASKTQERSQKILNGNVWAVIGLIALPMAIQNLLQAIYALLDTIFATGLGDNTVAAINYIGPANNLIVAIGQGISVAATTLIARRIAANDNEGYKKYVANSIYVLAITGLIMLVIGYPFAGIILNLTGINSDLYPIALDYFRAFILFSPFALLSGVYIGIKRAEGHSSIIFIIALFSVVVKSVVNFVFINKLNYGVEWFAMSTGIANLLVCLYGFYDLMLRRKTKRLAFSDFKMDKTILVAMVIMGLPVALEKSFLQFGHLVTHNYAQELGIMTEFSIANKINNLTLSFLSGVGMAITPIVSQNFAVNNFARIRSIVIKLSIINACIGLIMTLTLQFMVSPIISMIPDFSGNVDEVLRGFRIIGAATFFWGIMQVMLGTFHGYGKTGYNLIFGIIRLYGIRLPIMLFMYYLTAYPKLSVWIGAAASNILGAFIAIAIAVIMLPKANRLKLEKDSNEEVLLT